MYMYVYVNIFTFIYFLLYDVVHVHMYVVYDHIYL